jgi:methyl-accepting chemotaxis protein
LTDRNGYAPTHNTKFSQPQGKDPVWNAAHCRNRRIFSDPTGMAAARNMEKLWPQVYRRDMGGGNITVMMDVSSPINCKGRHWGAIRLGYTTDSTSYLNSERGTREEAIAMVRRAGQIYRTDGLDRLLAAVTDKSGPLLEKDLYVIVQDRVGKVIAHGRNPNLVGVDGNTIKDAKGKFFSKEMLDLARRDGAGWVDYVWANPATKVMENKSCYVEMVDDVILGVGIYST